MQHEPSFPEGRRESVHARQAERVHLQILADVKAGSGAWKRAQLTDISATGFRIAWFPNANAGQTVIVRIPGIEGLTAFIRRAGVEGIGCEFEHSLSPYVFEHIARHAGGATRSL